MAGAIGESRNGSFSHRIIEIVFVDHARILVAAGAGGAGSASFRREAHVPRGGPDGGDGGRGGDVVLVAEAGMTTLGDFRRTRHFRAQPGGRGGRQRSHGRNGAEVVLRVPPGTVALTDSGETLGELLNAGERLVVARGGRGGRGNVHFATATHRAPRHYEKGDPGDERWIELELKTIADIGLIGAPNAGKSTLLAALTAAAPRIGPYPFTTTSPNLGVFVTDDEVDAEPRTALLADVPGLIAGAHAGHGLGHAFLRHVERTRALLGVVNGTAEDPVAEWQSVAEELRLHDPELLRRPMRLVVTKLDLPEVRERFPALRRGLAADPPAIGVSAHDGSGLPELERALGEALAEADRDEARRTAGREAVHVFRFDPLDQGWQVMAEADGFRVRGRRIEEAANRTDFENEESRERFERLLARLGIEAELRRIGVQAGATVRIGQAELEWGEE
jgi:GTP-binding protein